MIIPELPISVTSFLIELLIFFLLLFLNDKLWGFPNEWTCLLIVIPSYIIILTFSNCIHCEDILINSNLIAAGNSLTELFIYVNENYVMMVDLCYVWEYECEFLELDFI